MQSYYDKQFQPIIDQAKKSEYKPQIKVFPAVEDFDAMPSNYISVTVEQLERILAVLNEKG